MGGLRCRIVDPLPTVRVNDGRRPACTIGGQMAPATPPAFSGELERHVPGAELHGIEGAGPFAYLERPEAFFRTARGVAGRTAAS